MSKPTNPPHATAAATTSVLTAEQRSQLLTRLENAFNKVSGDPDMEKLRVILTEYLLAP
jgi:hypothetical protein